MVVMLANSQTAAGLSRRIRGLYSDGKGPSSLFIVTIAGSMVPFELGSHSSLIMQDVSAT